MKILVASDSFKGTLTSREIGRILLEELSPDHQVDYYPVSDGGEGFLDSLEGFFPGRKRSVRCKDPLGRPIKSDYFLTDERTAIIESAQACGLGLLEKNERDPGRAGTCGVGMLILDALEQGATEVYLGLGGSATKDGGIGLLGAMGVKMADHIGRSMERWEAGALDQITSLDTHDFDSRIKGVNFHALCDVNNPLLGPLGATRVYGPQKGAGPEMIEHLESGMGSWADVVKRSTGQDFSGFSGAGAAGGLGFCLKSFFGADLVNGIETVIGLLELEQKADSYDLIITGEGKLDPQTDSGKVPLGMLRLGAGHKVPVVCLCGIDESDRDLGFSKIFSVIPGQATFAQSLSSPEYFFRKMIRNEVAPWLGRIDRRSILCQGL